MMRLAFQALIEAQRDKKFSNKLLGVMGAASAVNTAGASRLAMDEHKLLKKGKGNKWLRGTAIGLAGVHAGIGGYAAHKYLKQRVNK